MAVVLLTAWLPPIRLSACNSAHVLSTTSRGQLHMTQTGDSSADKAEYASAQHAVDVSEAAAALAELIAEDDSPRTAPVVKVTAAKLTTNEFTSLWLERVNAEIVTVAILLALTFFPFVASEFVSAFAIPSRSMDATLQIGDVVLAEKISSRLRLPLDRGDIVFFSAPQELKEIVLHNGDHVGPRDRFVKRVAAIAGDVVQVDTSGRSVRINDVLYTPPALACREEPLPLIPSTGAGHAAVDPEVQERLAVLLATGKIDLGEAGALLREIAPPRRETAEGAIESSEFVGVRTEAGVVGTTSVCETKWYYQAPRDGHLSSRMQIRHGLIARADG